ncbi:MAG: glycosyltransferase [Pseudodesulfovibrio sp.]
MSEAKNVCLIDGSHSLARGFEQAGCVVLELRGSPAPFLSLPEALAGHGFRPDLVVQEESLGRRCLVTGLDQADCPVLHWCVDPHLNAHWHAAWARLFDLTCSTQKAWIPRLRERGARDVRWLPWFGHALPWTDFADRTTDVAFVGRVTAQRPARRWLVEFLRRRTVGFRLGVHQDVDYRRMLDIYRDARIVPNESIFGEVNFRLFEGASCGCLVLGQNLGGEQAELFEPGREMDTCAHVAELDHKLSLYLRNGRLTAAMGRAAFERVRAEHLAVHRARRILEYAADAAGNRARGPEAEAWTALAAAALWEAGMLALPAGDVLARLEGVAPGGDVAESVLRIQAKAGKLRALEANVAALLGGELFADHAGLNLAGSMAALRLDHFDGAKAFWYRHCRASGGRECAPPRDPAGLLTLWARDLQRRDRTVRAGFPFDPGIHLPGSACECLLLLLHREPEHLPTLRRLDELLRPVAGLEQARVGFLSILTLHERDDWRLALEIGLADLQSFRLDSGLEELRLARSLARKAGQEPFFARALAARDPAGLVAGRLS